MTPAPRAPWDSDARLDPESASVGARVIVGTFAPATARMICEALRARSLSRDASALDGQEAFLLAFYLRELIGGDDGMGQGPEVRTVAPDGGPVGPNPADADGLRTDDATVGVGAVGEGSGPLLQVRDADGLGNPWVRVWRLTWGLR